MTQKQDTIFADGMNIYPPNEKTASFLFGNASFNVKKFTAFLQANQDEKGYVKVKFPISSKTGQPYCALDTYVLKKKEPVEDDGMTTKTNGEQINIEDIPF